MAESSQNQDVLVDIPNEYMSVENRGKDLLNNSSTVSNEEWEFVPKISKKFNPPNAENLSRKVRLKPSQVRPPLRKGGGQWGLIKSTLMRKYPMYHFSITVTPLFLMNIKCVAVYLKMTVNLFPTYLSDIPRLAEFKTASAEDNYFGDIVRAGKHVEAKKVLDDRGVEILKTRYKTNLDLFFIVDLNKEHKEIGEQYADVEQEDDRLDNAEMEVTPLHLAIISKQTLVIQTIIEYIINKVQEEKQEQKQKIPDLLREVLESKVELKFYYDVETYDKADRSLDGMNAFHLACKYHPEAISVIFEIFNKQYDDQSTVLNFLRKTDNHVKQTPLHVAARSSTTTATRYK